MQSTKRWPDFFIVGAPKCGTTSLNEYLRQHPDVFIPPQKELHYFGSDLIWRQRYHDRDIYPGLFSNIPRDKLAGEASVFYLLSKMSAREIERANPSAKIIAVVRDPIEMIYSLYQEGLRSGSENQLTLDAALDAEIVRRNGGMSISARNPGVEQALYYSEIARYAEQLKRYVDAFGKSHVHIVFYDDFKRDTATSYRAILEFLGIDSRTESSLGRHNEHRSIRRPALWRLVKHPPECLRTVWRLGIPTRLRGRILSRASHWYLDSTPRPPLPTSTRQRIREMYSAEMNRFSKMTGRDLSHWLSVE